MLILETTKDNVIILRTCNVSIPGMLLYLGYTSNCITCYYLSIAPVILMVGLSLQGVKISAKLFHCCAHMLPRITTNSQYLRYKNITNKEILIISEFVDKKNTICLNSFIVLWYICYIFIQYSLHFKEQKHQYNYLTI